MGCSPWGREESDTTKRLHFHFSLSCTGEGNGNPLQCSCLENRPVATGDRLVPSEVHISCSPRVHATEHVLHGRAGGDGV